jgi:hypothetical protein
MFEYTRTRKSMIIGGEKKQTPNTDMVIKT